MPAYPSTEIEFAQASDPIAIPGFDLSSTSFAYDGLVNLRRAGQGAMPYEGEWLIAHEIAHQWWGMSVSPCTDRDDWTQETFSQIDALRFVQDTFGRPYAQQRVTAWRNAWEVHEKMKFVSAALTDASANGRKSSVDYAYGPFVFEEMLRRRIGDGPFYGAQKGLLTALAHRTVTTEDVKVAFEQASGQDLGDFFDYWVWTGFVPALTLTLDGTHAKVTSDVPFGTIDVPVGYVVDHASTSTVIRVVDGEGSAELPTNARHVALDPERTVLARARTVVGR
jgi:hypothetical protein